jgi:serine/threonine-protein kinase
MTSQAPTEVDSPESGVADPWLGALIGERYRVDCRIGEGGMGVIYSGQHCELGRRVAIKRLDSKIAKDAESFERFRNEAIAASGISNPHVVQVFDWGKADDGSPFLVMELLEGSDLRALLAREGRLPAHRAAAIALQVLRALISTHHAHIVHRDLKPENVFLCNDGSDQPFVKLLDFGISKRTAMGAAAQQLTRSGVIVGTAAYMSPEQARGDLPLDERSDLYSVGVILYETLTGQVPHRARTYEGTLVQICTRDADDVRLLAPLVPERLASVIRRALQRDREARYGSARQFYDALVEAMDLPTRPSDPPGPSRDTLASGGAGSARELAASLDASTSLEHAVTVSADTAPPDTSATHPPSATQRAEPNPSLEPRSATRSMSLVPWLILAGLVAVVVGVPLLTQRPTPGPDASALRSSVVNQATTGAASANTVPSASQGKPTTTMQSPPVPLDSAATDTQHVAREAPKGASPGRSSTARPGSSPRAPNTPPENPGVASGLKLRRSMQ